MYERALQQKQCCLFSLLNASFKVKNQLLFYFLLYIFNFTVHILTTLCSIIQSLRDSLLLIFYNCCVYWLWNFWWKILFCLHPHSFGVLFMYHPFRTLCKTRDEYNLCRSIVEMKSGISESGSDGILSMLNPFSLIICCLFIYKTFFAPFARRNPN